METQPSLATTQFVVFAIEILLFVYFEMFLQPFLVPSPASLLFYCLPMFNTARVLSWS